MEIDAEATAQLEAALGGETPQETPQDPKQELIEYYLGDKASKIPTNAELAFKEGGQVQRIPLSKVLNGYRMASHAERKFEEANKLKGQWESTQGEYQKAQERLKTLEPFEALQKWSEELQTKDPAGYNLLMDTIERVKSGTYSTEGGVETNALHATISELRQKIEDLTSWKSEYEKSMADKQAEEDLKFVDGEIVEIKKAYPEINLDELDENGISLARKVENWGAQKGYQTFTDAFHAHFRDQIAKILVQRGKNEAIKDLKSDKSRGIVARSSIPFDNGHPTEANDRDKMVREFESILSGST